MSIESANLRSYLYTRLKDVYGTLHLRAFQITSHDPSEFLPTTESINRSLERWADHELKRSGENADLTRAKQKVLRAFEMLLSMHSSRAAATKNCCRVCNSPLVTQWLDGPLACETCVGPVHAAIDQLVRDSTKMFSPEKLMNECRSVIQRIEAARRAPFEKS